MLMITILIITTAILTVQLNVLVGFYTFQKYKEIKYLKEVEQQTIPTLQDLLSNL
jgi:hypothetical protein